MNGKIKILLLFFFSSICVFSQDFCPKGYRCFVDFGGSLESYNEKHLGKGVCVSISTSHGWMFNPYVFLGGGFGCEYHFANDYLDSGPFFIPLFFDFRSNFINKRHTPFFDVKIGYSIQGKSGGDLNGSFYFNPSLGYSFGIKPRSCVNLSVGYTLQMVNLEITEYEYNYFYSSYGSIGYLTGSATVQKKPLHSVALKVGFEF